MMPRRPSWPAVLAVIVVLVAVVGTVTALPGREPPTPAEQTREVASTLRCPACLGEHVADSTSPVAESMRLVVAEQLAAGRSPDEVRAWFADAYGDEVLLDPPRRGVGWALWLVPLVVVAATALWFTRRRGRPALWTAAVVTVVAALGVWWLAPGILPTSTGAPPPDGQDAAATGSDSPGTTASSDAVVGVLKDAVADQPGRVELRAALARTLDEAGHADAAAAQWAAAARLRPLDPDLRYQQAFTLARTGSPSEAIPLLEQTLALAAEHPPTLLLLGSLLEESEPERSAALLERYRATRTGDTEEGP